MATRLTGVLLFLPVPLVLFLFTRTPLGVLPSLGIGIALMLTHRVYARPWALSRASARCLWCGGDVLAETAAVPQLVVRDPLGRAGWAACPGGHARAARAVLAWTERRSGALKVGILGTLGLFLAWALAGGAGLSGARFDDAVSFFRLGIALSVLPLGWLALRGGLGEPAAVVRSPFPVHLSALVGQRAVLWLFRLIGLLWLAQGALHVAERAAR